MELKYKGFIVEYIPNKLLLRENKNGEKEYCDGALYTIYSDVDKLFLIDVFSAAVGYELPDDSDENIKMFAREVIDMQYKHYCRMKEVGINGTVK